MFQRIFGIIRPDAVRKEHNPPGRTVPDCQSTAEVPEYIAARIRQRLPGGVPVVPGSTPVISFGDARKAKVATLGWNPSKCEFLHDKGRDKGRELAEENRRLETLTSIKETNLAHASNEAVSSVFNGCNNYFFRNPYRLWFDKLEKVLKHTGASYYDGSACHLDFVQWATDPVWSKLKLSRTRRDEILEADLSFLRHQLSQKNIQLLLLNGTGIVAAYQKLLHGQFTKLPISSSGKLKLELFVGRDTRERRVIGWNINLQSTPGVSNLDIEAIGAAVGAELGKEWERP